MYNIEFIGLGRIGYNLAGNINNISNCNIIVLCLQTYI